MRRGSRGLDATPRRGGGFVVFRSVGRGRRHVQAGSIWIWRVDVVGRRGVVVYASGLVGSLDPVPGDLRRLFFLILLPGGLSPMALASLLVGTVGGLVV